MQILFIFRKINTLVYSITKLGVFVKLFLEEFIMVFIKKVNESFVRVTGEYDQLLNISNYFSFFTDNYMWSPKYRSGIWDGKLRLFNLRNNLLPIGLFPRLKYFCKESCIDTEIDFKKTSIKITDENIIDFSKKKLKMEITLRDYQVNAIRESFKAGKLIVKSPTSSGKSAIIYLIQELYRAIHKGSKVLIIVPTISLVEQMKGDFLEYSENSAVDISGQINTVYSGQERDFKKQITVSTWQSLQNIKKKKFFQQFKCVLVDECHSCENAIQIKNIIESCSQADMKVGFTGTLSDPKVNKIQLEGLFGKVNAEVTTKKLMERQLISKLNIKVFVLNYKDDIKRVNHKSLYHEEMQFLQELDSRTDFIIKTINSIDKNILFLFRNLSYGTKIFELLNRTIKGRKIYYVAGSTKVEVREQVRKVTNLDRNAIIVASLQVFSTGINLPALDYVIFGQTFKSKIKVLQSIGRVLRKTEKKNKAVLIDIVDNLTWRRRKNYAFKHALDRISIYDKEQFNYDIKEIDI